MPLPDHPLTLHGGCNCRAIRYKIEVPQLSERPLYPFTKDTLKLTFPIILTDHCNDCHRATGSILPIWICVPAPMMTCILEPVNSASDAVPTSPSPEAWKPAQELFNPSPDSEKYHLKFFRSSERATRTFCGRCGTNLTYAIAEAMGDGWPVLFDVSLGTLVREDLEGDWMAPMRHCWVKGGIPWVGRLTNGVGVCRGMGILGWIGSGRERKALSRRKRKALSRGRRDSAIPL